MIKIKVPSSSANLGPGFDVLGLALSLYLELHVTVASSSSASVGLNCEISCEGLGADTIRKAPEENLITQVALYVLRCHGHHEFAKHTKVHIINNIPLSRGLGSSGAAVVAGVILANEVGDLGLTKERILDYCLMIERHPDNITAALYGGFVGACLSELDAEDMARTEIPLSEVLPEPAGGEDTGKTPPIPPLGIGQFEKFSFAPEIKAIVVIPDFKVDTADARKVLPSSYSRSDTVGILGTARNYRDLLSKQVFNSQRVALLTYLLGQPPTNPAKVHLAMQDRLHQPYRSKLIPGLSEIIRQLTPSSHPGLLGICLSGEMQHLPHRFNHADR